MKNSCPWAIGTEIGLVCILMQNRNFQKRCPYDGDDALCKRDG